MAYTTLVAGTTITAAWANASVRDQGVTPFANAGARSSAITAPVEGMVTHLNDVNSFGVYSGAAWSSIGPVHGVLTTWTPTVTQSGAVTVTNTYSRFTRVGRLITGWFNLAVTGSGTASNVITIGNLPATAASTGVKVGFGEVYDSSLSNKFQGGIHLASTTSLDYRWVSSTSLDNRLGIVGMTVALGSSDTLEGVFMYEAAADA